MAERVQADLAQVENRPKVHARGLEVGPFFGSGDDVRGGEVSDNRSRSSVRQFVTPLHVVCHDLYTCPTIRDTSTQCATTSTRVSRSVSTRVPQDLCTWVTTSTIY